MQASRDVMIELPPSASLDGARHILAAEQATGRKAFVDNRVLACLTGHAENLIEPASALPALELTLDARQRLT